MLNRAGFAKSPFATEHRQTATAQDCTPRTLAATDDTRRVRGQSLRTGEGRACRIEPNRFAPLLRQPPTCLPMSSSPAAGFAVAFGGERPQVVGDAEQKPQDFEVDLHRVEHRRSLAGRSGTQQGFQQRVQVPFDPFPEREAVVAGNFVVCWQVHTMKS